MTNAPSTSASAASEDRAPRVSSRAMRDTLLAELVVQIKGLFDACPEVQTVGYFVAQYWDDEAEDAVHASVRISTDVVTHAGLLKDIYDHEDDDDWTKLAAKAEPFYPRVGDDNDSMVVAFAAYATESDQDEPKYTPYALFHRNGSDVTTTVVGRILRPEWEDVVPASQQPPMDRSNRKLVFMTFVAIMAIVTWWMVR